MSQPESDPNAHNRVDPADRGPGMDEPVHYTYARPEDRPPHRDVRLVDAVKAGDAEVAARLLREGTNVHQRAEQDWTPLHFAAGRGDRRLVELLLEHGADVRALGRDRLTARAVARAAGHRDVAQILERRERELGLPPDDATARRYCKAYYLRELRQFGGWREGRKNWNVGPYWSDSIKATFEKPLEGEDVVFLHQDYSVTRSMWHGEHVIFDDVSPDWVVFCEKALGYAIPDDLP